MESDGRRKLKKLHCMKCGRALVERITQVPIEHIPKHLLNSPQNTLRHEICSDETCGWTFYNNPIPIVAAIVEYIEPAAAAKAASSTSSSSSSSSTTISPSQLLADDRRILLVRGHGWPASWHGLVTGFLEAREDPKDGVLREVKEELGLDGEIGEFIGVFPFPRANQIVLAYHIIVRGPQTIKLQEEEIAGYKSVPLTKLQPWSEGTGPAVKEFLIRQLGSSPPNSLTFDRRNVRFDEETGQLVEKIQSKL